MGTPFAPLTAEARSLRAPLAASFPHESRFFELPTAGREGAALHYVDEGPSDGSAPTVLCVHGNPTWSFYWRRLVDELSGEARVVAPDHLGMGLSSRAPGGVRLAEHVANLVALVDALDLRNVTLVCHDWGGAIGFGAALARPDRFDGFVVTNTAAFPSGMMPRRIAACRIPGLGRLAVQGGNAFVRAALRMTTVVPLSADARRGLLAPYGSWARREQVWRFVEDIPMRPEHPSWNDLVGIADRLESLRGLPMEIVWGMRDWCFSPSFLAKWRERFPGAAVTELPGAGHYVMEDAPESVALATRRVLGAAASQRSRA
ncbi:MAG: alpha/beta fold hydrolase [Planctomycetota bacterium]